MFVVHFVFVGSFWSVRGFNEFLSNCVARIIHLNFTDVWHISLVWLVHSFVLYIRRSHNARFCPSVCILNLPQTKIHIRRTANSLQKQVSVMSMNLSAKLDELQRGDRHMETTVALCEIRTQLSELTKSVESCQSEVSEVSAFPVNCVERVNCTQAETPHWTKLSFYSYFCCVHAKHIFGTGQAWYGSY